jgi:hypothetical protein
MSSESVCTVACSWVDMDSYHMSSESVCAVACSWVDMDSYHMHLFITL